MLFLHTAFSSVTVLSQDACSTARPCLHHTRAHTHRHTRTDTHRHTDTHAQTHSRATLYQNPLSAAACSVSTLRREPTHASTTDTRGKGWNEERRCVQDLYVPCMRQRNTCPVTATSTPTWVPSTITAWALPFGLWWRALTISKGNTIRGRRLKSANKFIFFKSVITFNLIPCKTPWWSHTKEAVWKEYLLKANKPQITAFLQWYFKNEEDFHSWFWVWGHPTKPQYWSCSWRNLKARKKAAVSTMVCKTLAHLEQNDWPGKIWKHIPHQLVWCFKDGNQI